MTLQDAEVKLSELNDKIAKLLNEREDVIKEWNIAFNSENPENIICIDKNESGFHELYLVNSDFKMLACHFSERDINDNINDFYRIIDNSMKIISIANNRGVELLEYQKNLVYAKAIEIREDLLVAKSEIV